MDTFTAGQIFTEIYPPEAAIWCNENNHYIVELESLDGVRQFQIQAIPGPSLEEVKSQKIASLKKERDVREEAPVEYKEKLWDFDTKSRDRINVAATALEIGGVETITWTAYDDSSLELTAEDLKTIVAIAALRGDTLHKTYRELRDAVTAAESIEEVKSIIWE
jgi:hypothetical protein